MEVTRVKAACSVHGGHEQGSEAPPLSVRMGVHAYISIQACTVQICLCVQLWHTWASVYVCVQSYQRGSFERIKKVLDDRGMPT